MRLNLSAWLLIPALLTGCKTAPPASMTDRPLALVGGRIAQGPDQPALQDGGILIEDGRIRLVGSREAILRESGGARLIELGGKTILPGLADAHAHVEGLGVALETVSLVGTRSFDEVIERVAASAHTIPPGEWILGRGWDQNDWETQVFPSAGPLDRAVPDHPVVLTRIDGHAILANGAAMRAAGVGASTADPAGGRILRDASGAPSGVFVDNAMALVRSAIPAPSGETRMRRVRRAIEEIASKGLTSVHDAGVDAVGIEMYRELDRQGDLLVRIYAMLEDDEPLLRTWFDRGPFAGNRLVIRSVKLYADGALGSRGAALLEAYADDPENRGLVVSAPEHMTEVARRAREAGFQVGIHAIGDRGIRTSIEVFEAAGLGREDRPRIEHLQILNLDDLPRLRRLGLIASMQPTHGTSDMPWAEDRVGPERIRGGYVWKTLKRSGVELAFGSDFPVEEVNPFLGIHAAVTRQDLEGHPPGGWYPEEALSVTEAIDAFSRGAAFAAFAEHERGSIAPGMAADLTIVDRDPWSVEPAELAGIEVVYTIVGGEIVYSRDQ